MNHLSLLRHISVWCCLLCTHGVLPQRPSLEPARGDKYMFCIGINNYLAGTRPSTCQVCKDRGIKNLNGCLNDVDTISRLFTKYYGFMPENIIQLRDQQASRAAIFQTFDQLLRKCKKGDYLVFFYSGHGSYEYEKANDNQQKTGKGYRNTILPADIIKPGITDINSAELNKVFSGFADKGVVLTIITDCCHSATNTRGSTSFEVDSGREVKPALEARTALPNTTGITRLLDQSGALTIGSSQDNEIAVEALVLPKIYYGAFTISLCRSVTEWSQAPVDVLLERTISKLRFLNKKQTPNMEAGKRLGMNLPGTAPAQPRKTAWSLSCTACSANRLPVIPAGFMDDLSNDDILVDPKTKDSIRVTNLGFSETEVVLVNRDKNWKAADQASLNFQVLKKLPNPDPPLKLFLGNPVAADEFEQMIKSASLLQAQNDRPYHWIVPSLEKVPEAVLFYTGNWKLNRNRVPETVQLNGLENTEIDSLMQAAKIKNAYLQLPPPQALAEQVAAKFTQRKNRNILVVSSAEAADFILAGHMINGDRGIAFGWEKTVQGYRKGDAKKTGLPALTDFFPVLPGNKYPVDSLTDRATRLCTLANWLSMRSPVADRSMIFPYHLTVKNLAGNGKAGNSGTGKSATGDKLEIGIEKDAGSRLVRDSIKPLFIYVMSMDPKGNTYLLYPQPRTSILNYPNTILHDTTFYHLATVRHTTPGTYHYFFIALREAVSNRDVFTRRGVVRGEQAEFSDNPLEALLNENGTGQRGEIKSFDHWMLKTVDVITTGKG